MRKNKANPQKATVIQKKRPSMHNKQNELSSVKEAICNSAQSTTFYLSYRITSTKLIIYMINRILYLYQQDLKENEIPIRSLLGRY